jgi:hypothetical protein
MKCTFHYRPSSELGRKTILSRYGRYTASSSSFATQHMGMPVRLVHNLRVGHLRMLPVTPESFLLIFDTKGTLYWMQFSLLTFPRELYTTDLYLVTTTFLFSFIMLWDTRKRSYLKHYATSCKGEGSILDDAIDFFN